MSDVLEARTQLVAELKAYGVAQLVISYSGSGDSGQMDDVNAFMTDEDVNTYNSTDIDIISLHHDPERIVARVANKLLGKADEKLSEQLMDWGYDLLEHVGASNWCNNDGGQGTITIFVNELGDEDKPGRIEIAHSVNETTINSESYEL